MPDTTKVSLELPNRDALTATRSASATSSRIAMSCPAVAPHFSRMTGMRNARPNAKRPIALSRAVHMASAVKCP